jgi:hypothetical protein
MPGIFSIGNMDVKEIIPIGTYSRLRITKLIVENKELVTYGSEQMNLLRTNDLQDVGGLSCCPGC